VRANEPRDSDADQAKRPARPLSAAPDRVDGEAPAPTPSTEG